MTDITGQGGYSSNVVLIALLASTILGGIAYYEYSDVMMVANRQDGRDLVLDAVKRQEDHFAQHRQYAASLEDLGYDKAADQSVASKLGLYKLVIGEADARAFTFIAHPQEEQLADSKCAAFTYSSKGTAKSATGGNGPGCW